MHRISRIYLFLTLIWVFFSSCKKKDVETQTASTTEYSTLLNIVEITDGIQLCRIADPWNEGETLAQYLLVPDSIKNFDSSREKELVKSYGKSTVVRTPLKRITLANSCHGYLMYELEAIDHVAVMCEGEYVRFEKVRKEIETGRIADCGSSMTPNIETILANGSDAIFISPFENAVGNIATLPIPIIYCADYMETSPIGRAEWMKFYGALIGKETEAEALFEKVLKGYSEIIENAEENDPHKKSTKLLAEIPYQASWYVPGGQSTMGILYRDAGYDYPWADDTHSGSLTLSQEMVLAKAQDANVWVFKYYADHDYSLAEFLQQNPYFAQFKAVKEGNVFGCNTMFSDYYDVIPFRPDILLYELNHLGENYFKRLE